MGEPNQVVWRGIRPIDPPEYIPVSAYKPNEIKYTSYVHAENQVVVALSTPVGQTYHIFSIFSCIYPEADGFGLIEHTDSDGVVRLIYAHYSANTYGIVNPPIILPSPMDLLEKESIKVSSSADGFYAYCSIIYTKEQVIDN